MSSIKETPLSLNALHNGDKTSSLREIPSLTHKYTPTISDPLGNAVDNAMWVHPTMLGDSYLLNLLVNEMDQSAAPKRRWL